MDWNSDYQRAVAKSLAKSDDADTDDMGGDTDVEGDDMEMNFAGEDGEDFGKPLPKKEKRKGESEFQHKIRQWSDEVKQRPGRFPGGQKQAVAIAAQQAGVGKKAIPGSNDEGVSEPRDLAMSTSKSLFDHLYKSEDMDSDDQTPGESLEDAMKGEGMAGYGYGNSMGSGYASGVGGGGTAAIQGAPGAANTLAHAGSSGSKPASPGTQGGNSDGGQQAGGSGTGSGGSRQFRGNQYATPGNAQKANPAAAALSAEDYHHHEAGGDCTDCKLGKCTDTVHKALHSRALSIPFYMRPGVSQKYDPTGIERSATQQTSRMYTSLAPQVRESIANTEDVSEKRAKLESTERCAAHGVAFKSQNGCPLCRTAKSLSATRTDLRFNR
jgi:hypothetical protein